MMDLLNFIGCKVKIILQNNYYFIGSVIDAEENSLELIRYIREQKNNNTLKDKINSTDIRRQIDSLSFNKIQHLYDNIYLNPEEFNFASKIYKVKEIKSYLQMQADLAIDNKKPEEDFFKIIEECCNKIKDINNFAREFLSKQKLI